MSSEGYHEPLDHLSGNTQDFHRAITSLIEELEAIDWYTQRAEACSNDELRAILIHNRDEEVEHAMMALEWLRRNHEVFRKNVEVYIGTEAPITEIEGEMENANTDTETASELPSKRRAPSPLGIGRLRRLRKVT